MTQPKTLAEQLDAAQTGEEFGQVLGQLFSTAAHAKCPRCARLLAPVDNELPLHKTPTLATYPGGSTPLTSRDNPWCL